MPLCPVLPSFSPSYNMMQYNTMCKVLEVLVLIVSRLPLLPATVYHCPLAITNYTAWCELLAIVIT